MVYGPQYEYQVSRSEISMHDEIYYVRNEKIMTALFQIGNIRVYKTVILLLWK